MLAASLFGSGITLLDVSPEQDYWRVTERWQSDDMKPEFPDMVVQNGYAYGFDISTFCCVDLATGKRMWRGGHYGHGQVILLADQELLLVLSEKGEAVLLKANPQRHEELGHFQALHGKTWNHPVVAGGRLYCAMRRKWLVMSWGGCDGGPRRIRARTWRGGFDTIDGPG